MMANGLILFAHGARDPRWAMPLVRLRNKVAGLLPAGRVELAFLEFMDPDLRGAATKLVENGCGSLRIVPIFLGQGGHVRRDLPQLVRALRVEFPDLAIDCASAAGEDEAVLDALAAYCAAAAIGQSPG